MLWSNNNYSFIAESSIAIVLLNDKSDFLTMPPKRKLSTQNSAKDEPNSKRKRTQSPAKSKPSQAKTKTANKSPATVKENVKQKQTAKQTKKENDTLPKRKGKTEKSGRLLQFSPSIPSPSLL